MLKVNHLNFLKTQIHKCYLWSTVNHDWLDPTKCSESCFRISELTKSYLDGKKEFIRIISNLKEDIQQWQQIQQHKNLSKVSHWLQISCVCDSRNKKGWVLIRYLSLFLGPRGPLRTPLVPVPLLLSSATKIPDSMLILFLQTLS